MLGGPGTSSRKGIRGTLGTRGRKEQGPASCLVGTVIADWPVMLANLQSRCYVKQPHGER